MRWWMMRTSRKLKDLNGIFYSRRNGKIVYVAHSLYLKRDKKGKQIQKSIFLHRFILNYSGKKVIDHINNNPLDNRKINLRICSIQQNLWNQPISRVNKSGYKGVSWHKTNKKWESAIKNNGKRFRLGYFQNKEEAALAYDKKARELFGEFARTNFKIPSQEGQTP